VLVVAGGGGGGCLGGGGGAGGFIYSNAFPVSVSNYTVTVGAGGAGTTNRAAQGSNGNNSVFGALTAIGGGGAGSYTTLTSGKSGGSGGGSGNGGSFGIGTFGQGNNGGAAVTSYGGGGGGGAGTVGTNGNGTTGGAGGAGLSCSISGTATNYAGGGGGGGDTAGAGGSGGGGAGSINNASPTAGSPNTGGGGGGSRNANSGLGYGTNGGSGIVIVRYAFIAATALPVISDGVSQNLSNTSADVVGTLGTNGSAGTATVYLYWSTTDGTNNPATWLAGGSVSNLGSGFADGTTFTNTLAGLAANTTYYWNYSAVNASGTVWGATAGSPSFKTLGAPGVINGAATSVTEFTATLNGNLTNGASAHVYILQGLTDGVWSVTNDVGPRTEGGFAFPVSGLTLATKYYYTSYATNVYGTALATPSTNFTTLSANTYTFNANNAIWTTAGNWTGGSYAPPRNGDIGIVSNVAAWANGNLYNVGVETPPAQIWVRAGGSLQLTNGVTLAEHNIILDGGKLGVSSLNDVVPNETATNNGSIRVNRNSTIGLNTGDSLKLNGPIQDNGANTGMLQLGLSGYRSSTIYLNATNNTWTGGSTVGGGAYVGGAASVVYAGAPGCLGTGPITITNGLLVTAQATPSGTANINAVAVTNVFGSGTVTVCGASAKYSSRFNNGQLDVMGDSPNATYILNTGGVFGMHTNLVGGTLILNGGIVGATDFSGGSGASYDNWPVNPTFYGPVRVRSNSYLGSGGGNEVFSLSGGIQDDGNNTGALLTFPPAYYQQTIKLYTTNSTWTGGFLAQGHLVYAAASNCLGRGAIVINNAETYPGRRAFQPSGFPPSELFQLSVPWAGMNISSFTVQSNGFLIVCDSNVVGSVPITLGPGAMLMYKGTPAGLATMSFSGNNVVSDNGLVGANIYNMVFNVGDTFLVNTSVTFTAAGGGGDKFNINGYIADGTVTGKVIGVTSGGYTEWVRLNCATNSYSGGTDVNRGPMEVLVAGALSTGNVNVNSGGRLKTSASNSLGSVVSAGNTASVNANGVLELNSTETNLCTLQTGAAFMMDAGGSASKFTYGTGGNIQLSKGAILDTSVTTRPSRAVVTGQLLSGDGRFGLYEGHNGAVGNYTATRYFGDDNNTNIWRGLGLLNCGGTMICTNTMVTNAAATHLDFCAQRDATFTFQNASLRTPAVLLDGQGTFIFQNGSGTSTYSSITFNGGSSSLGGLKIVTNGDVCAGATINVSNGWFAVSYTNTLAGLTVNLGSGAVFNITTNLTSGTINLNPGSATYVDRLLRMSNGANWIVYAGTQIGVGVGRGGGNTPIYNLPTNGLADFVGWGDYYNGNPLNLNKGLVLGNNTRFTSGPYNDGYYIVNNLTVTNSDGGAGGETIQLAVGSTQGRLCSPGGTTLTMNLPVTLNAGAGKLIVGDANLFNALILGGVSGYLPITQNGTVYLTSTTNQIGDVDIQAGTLEVTALASLGTSAATGGSRTIATSNAATMWLNFSNPVLTNTTLRGSGTMVLSTATDTLTLTNAAGVSGAIQPGNAGPLSVQGNLTLAASATTQTLFSINIGKTGGMMTNGMLAVSGNVTNLNNAALYVSFDPSVRAADVAGKVFTILTCANDLTTAPHFNSVTWAAPATKGTVIYTNGAVQLSTITIPASGTTIFFR